MIFWPTDNISISNAALALAEASNDFRAPSSWSRTTRYLIEACADQLWVVAIRRLQP